MVPKPHSSKELLSHISSFYYVNTSVLLENIQFVKFIKTTSWARLVYFPLSHTRVYR